MFHLVDKLDKVFISILKRGPSGRYSDPVEREQLIQRLLRERDQTRQKAAVVTEQTEPSHDNVSSNGKELMLYV